MPRARRIIRSIVFIWSLRIFEMLKIRPSSPTTYRSFRNVSLRFQREENALRFRSCPLVTSSERAMSVPLSRFWHEIFSDSPVGHSPDQKQLLPDKSFRKIKEENVRPLPSACSLSLAERTIISWYMCRAIRGSEFSRKYRENVARHSRRDETRSCRSWHSIKWHRRSLAQNVCFYFIASLIVTCVL